MRDVSYFAPTSLGEAVQVLATHGRKSTVFAGGTDLVPKINYYELMPEVIVYIGKLGLDSIEVVDGFLVIGAGTSLAHLLASPLVAELAPALAVAAMQHSSVAIRTTATLGGNIANASPAADMVAPLLAMDASLRLISASGERSIALHDFYLGPGKTILEPGELITHVRVPPVKGQVVFLKLGKRKAQAHSVVMTAIRLHIHAGICREARIALGSMAPTPLRCTRTEELLAGHKITSDLLARCAASAIAESAPIDDQRATAWYRREAGQALVARALSQAAGLSRSGD